MNRKQRLFIRHNKYLIISIVVSLLLISLTIIRWPQLQAYERHACEVIGLNQ